VGFDFQEDNLNEFLFIIFALAVGTGVTFLFFGLLAAIVTAAGHNKYWGIASIIVPPVAIFYCLFNPGKAKYPLKLLAAGLVIIAVLLVIMLSAKYLEIL
jgi:hypothetical protein